MTELTIIRGPAGPDEIRDDFPRVVLTADRSTLHKRRWRGVAANGREFGFDLDRPLVHGDCFYADGETRYMIEQVSEAVLEMTIMQPDIAARVAWTLGNLHLVVQVLPDAIRVADDPVARRALMDGHISFQPASRVFLPISSRAHHHHAHAHD